METSACRDCSKTKATFHCPACEMPVCKKCAQFVDEQSFEFLDLAQSPVPAGAYCHHCFAAQVQPQLQEYESILERARQVSVFEIEQGKETRFFRRSEKPFRVESCTERPEALMRLAFAAARAGFNGLIDVDLVGKKERTGGSYQKLVWSGSGVPFLFDREKRAAKK